MSSLEFLLPDMGEGLSEAEIVRWLVAEGQHVERDEAVVEIETDKAVVSIPAPSSGVVERHAAEPGDLLGIGAVLFLLRPDAVGDVVNSSLSATVDELKSATESTEIREAPRASGRDELSPARQGFRPLASPAVRRLALERNVELRSVTGSGPGGRITRADVLSAIPSFEGRHGQRVETATRAVKSQTVVPLRGIRRQIAKTMTTSWQTIPHITDIREIDASNLVDARDRLRAHFAGDEFSFTFLPIFVSAIVEAIKSVPVFNASLDMAAETITYHENCNIGIATATHDGLIVPVLRNAERHSLRSKALTINRLISRARTRECQPDELSGGTFTITNFGALGTWIATPLIRPPEVAIAGFGRIAEKVLAIEGEIKIRPVLAVSVSADHRIIDGADMSLFINTLADHLTNPVLLVAGC